MAVQLLVGAGRPVLAVSVGESLDGDAEWVAVELTDLIGAAVRGS
ncbi:hypothetical protein [Kutzneria sp. CA-103260]|nr:hypothetical protein [Kutzneria sp. CA-103260]